MPCVRTLALAPPGSRGELYRTAPVSLVRAHCGLAVFDAVSAAVSEDAVLETDPHARRDTLPGTPPHR